MTARAEAFQPGHFDPARPGLAPPRDLVAKIIMLTINDFRLECFINTPTSF